MDPNTIAAWAAAVAAIVAAVALHFALACSTCGESCRRADARPAGTYVSIVLSHMSGQIFSRMTSREQCFFHLVLGNAGPTVARQRPVFIDPPFPQVSGHIGRSSTVASAASGGGNSPFFLLLLDV